MVAHPLVAAQLAEMPDLAGATRQVRASGTGQGDRVLPYDDPVLRNCPARGRLLIPRVPDLAIPGAGPFDLADRALLPPGALA
jgi:hypothetical protein